MPGYPRRVILGIDSSAGTAVAVVSNDGFIHADVVHPNPRGHAEVIGELITQALRDAEVTAGQITHVAAGMGPGPFTGLRVGIAAARAFAWARELPVVPVPSHDAAALHLMLHDALLGTERPPFAVVTDARRRELAYTVYTGFDDDGLPERTQPTTLAPADQLAIVLADLGATGVNVDAISGASIGILAARAGAAGRVDVDQQPVYLRAPDVTESAGPKRVTA